MNIVGLLISGGNSSVCLIKDGEIEFIADEERFSRVKGAPYQKPIRALKSALDFAGITLDEIDYFAVGWDHTKYPEKMREFFSESYPSYDQLDKSIQTEQLLKYDPITSEKRWEFMLRKAGLKGKMPEIRYFSHHLSHAASAYYLSGFDNAIVVSADAHGEENCTVIYKGVGNSIVELTRYEQPNSLGWFYSAFTEFLGFSANGGEGKLMGLAPYGEPNLVLREKLNKMLYWKNNRYVIDNKYLNNYTKTHNSRFTDLLIEEFGNPRVAESSLTKYHKDLAYEVQFKLETIMKNIVSYYAETYGINNICLAGGIAMNCKANAEIHRMKNVEKLFLNPASNDSGVSIGAALLLSKEFEIKVSPTQLEHAYWGTRYNNEEIKNTLDLSKIRYAYVDKVEEYAANCILEGKIIGWFQGRMEIGARALGNRSILAHPGIAGMKNKINKEVKFREFFRPFAPSILEDKQSEYLESSFRSPFMILADRVLPEKQKEISSVVHEDGSVRHQSVSSKTNSKYWNLINEFYKLTGIPMVLNTSLNVRGEPIAESPKDAIKCFYSNGLDVLILGNYILEKDVKYGGE